jgi:hypothetical protein
MLETVKTQSIHDKLTIFQIINYRKHGYTNIKVNNTNYAPGQPERVGGYTPDMSAVFDHKTTICMVETNDSMKEFHTIEQWRAFAKSAFEFHVIVPKNALSDAKEKAKINRINVDKYWYSENY